MLSDSQRETLEHLQNGARIVANADRSRWQIVLPNGFVKNLRKTTMNSLYYRQMVQQDQSDAKFAYVISERGRAVLNASEPQDVELCAATG